MQLASPARLLAVALTIGLLLGGCSTTPPHGTVIEQGTVSAEPAQMAEGQAAAGDAQIEKIPFRVGVSTATVEKLAKSRACTGGPGAGLITPPGPVEVYRMQCDSGKVFMARCELRQCKPM